MAGKKDFETGAQVKNLELDPRVQKIIDEEFSDYGKYLPTPQDVNVYRRKRAEYWDNVHARIKEVNALNGRTDNTAVNA